MLAFDGPADVEGDHRAPDSCPWSLNLPLLLSSRGKAPRPAKVVHGGIIDRSEATEARPISGTALALYRREDCGLKNTNDGFCSSNFTHFARPLCFTTARIACIDISSFFMLPAVGAFADAAMGPAVFPA